MEAHCDSQELRFQVFQSQGVRMFEIVVLGTDGKLYPGFFVDWHGLLWADEICKRMIENGDAVAFQVRRIAE